MGTGSSRIAWGIVLIVVLGMLLLRGLLVLFAGAAVGVDSAYLAGNVFGMVIVGLLLFAVIRNLLLKGLDQRRAYHAAQTRGAEPPTA